jgi:hypothetical protein
MATFSGGKIFIKLEYEKEDETAIFIFNRPMCSEGVPHKTVSQEKTVLN